MAINLLPPIQKQELKDEKLRKKIVFLLVLVLINMLFLVAIVFGLYLYVSQKDAELSKKMIEKEQFLKDPQSEEIKKIIESANQNLSKINSIKKEQVSVVDILEKLNNLLVPENIYLSSFSFQTNTSEAGIIGKVRLNGVARNREIVFTLKGLLSQEQDFQDVYFSPSSWIEAVNPSFTSDFNFLPAKK